MSKDLFIAKLPAKTTPEQLREMFSRVGMVTFVKRPKDFESGEYRSFAFVSMATEEEGRRAIETFNGYVVDGVTMVVKVSDKPIVTTSMPRPADAPSPPVMKRPIPASASTVGFNWDDRLEEVEPLLEELGTATTAKLVLVGRPLNHAMHAGVVMIALQNFPKQTGLPKGLPVPPPIPVNYVVYMTKKSWDKVQPLLEENEDDALVIEGFLTLDVELGAVAVIAMSVGTKFQKRQPENET
ncbi:MAG: RNA-binding protein [Anaerolineae bacterium]|nr:RNA-binding protein [Anaerolineae bacterium]MDW8171573.1 RNA-binding protein [Anaerolineae bacterium]